MPAKASSFSCSPKRSAASVSSTGTFEPGPTLELVPFGTTQLQILPGAAVGPTDGFVGITDHDVQVARGNGGPYFHDEAYGSIVYRIYTMQFPGNPGVLVRHRPAGVGRGINPDCAWLAARRADTGGRDRRGGGGAAGRGPGAAPGGPGSPKPSSGSGPPATSARRSMRAGRGRDQPGLAGIRRDDGCAGRMSRRARNAGW